MARVLKKRKATPEIDIKIVTRRSRSEQYILLNKKYLVGCSAKASPRYQSILEDLAELLKQGNMFTNAEAREFVASATNETVADAIVLSGKGAVP